MFLSLLNTRNLVIMKHWSSEQRAFAVKAYYKSNDSFVGAQRAFRRQFGLSSRNPVPSRGTIDLWVKTLKPQLARLKREVVVKKLDGLKKMCSKIIHQGLLLT
ncbi:unnamed protein product [Macrosiphum euphorbiae]|uniref:DUF4817 domain-containing protein n=1 Tax=Macrosiphum euphorbiae TaxID=13131 RepID=A0AAV0WSM3_9HEMI|nr:unnamed protein product [Macrosiphum euphorbiae]